MTKYDYMNQLAALLQDLPVEERVDALKYYQGYLDEAGPENEADAMKQLGSPQEVAARIKENLRQDVVPAEEGKQQESRYETYGQYHSQHTQETQRAPKEKKSHPAAWITVGVLGFPLWITLIALVFALSVTVLALIFALGLVAVALVLAFSVVGVICVIVGIGKLVVAPAAGVAIIGSGFILIALFILSILLCKLVFGTWIPSCTKWMKSIFDRRKKTKGVA